MSTHELAAPPGGPCKRTIFRSLVLPASGQWALRRNVAADALVAGGPHPSTIAMETAVGTGGRPGGGAGILARGLAGGEDRRRVERGTCMNPLERLIQTFRENLEHDRQRALFWFTGLRLRSPKPDWMRKCPRDPMHRQFADHGLLLRKGQVVWGELVQANVLLFEPGKFDCPANLLFSTVPASDAWEDDLGEIATQLYSRKGAEATEPELAWFARYLANEMERAFNVPLPTSFTSGKEVYMTTTMITRRDLPHRQLTSRRFPLLVAPGLTPASMLLPGRYWHEEVLRTRAHPHDS